MSENSFQTVADLFQSAQDTGELSQIAVDALNIPDMGADIQAGLGIQPDDVQAQEVTLVASLIDNSGSIRMAGNSQIVRDGHNLLLDSLNGTKQGQAGSVLMLTRFFDQILCPFSQLDQVPRLDTHNYNPGTGTPLYDETAALLGTVLAKSQQFEDDGVTARTVSVIITDGADQHSEKHLKPESIEPIVREMLMQERHIIAAVGIDDGYTDFKDIFNRMGLRDDWILTPKNSQSEIRAAFAMVSQSAVQASQGGGSFSQTAIGGFMSNP